MKKGQKLKPLGMLEVLSPKLLLSILQENGCDGDELVKQFKLCFPHVMNDDIATV